VILDDDLFARLYPSLRRLAAVVRPREVDADDLVQEALARTIAACPLSGYDDVGAYLRTTIVNLARNHRRTFARRPPTSARSSGAEAATRDAYPSDLDDLRRLKVNERAVLYLSVVESRGYAEIGRILGCSEQAARARASRAMRRLRVELREEIAHDQAL
jgi:RNA polymerase sigma factor (sigma-70 family)